MKKFLLICVLGTVGCTDATFSKVTSYNTTFKISLFSGGQLVREYHSTGRVESEEHTDGWFFVNKETGKLVRVSGTISIEQE